MKTPVLLMPSSLSSCLDVQLVPFNWILPISILTRLGLCQIKTKQKCPVYPPSNALLLLIAKFVRRAVYTHWLHSLTSHLALGLAFAPSVFKNAHQWLGPPITSHFSRGIFLLLRVSHPPFLIPSDALNPPAVSRVNKEGVAFHTFLLCAYISTYIVYKDMFCMSGFFFVWIKMFTFFCNFLFPSDTIS